MPKIAITATSRPPLCRACDDTTTMRVAGASTGRVEAHVADVTWECSQCGTRQEDRYLDLAKIDYAYRPTASDGSTGYVHCWTSPSPNEGDYLLLRNGVDRATRYKVTACRLDMRVHPNAMWTADVRHAPHSRP